MDSFPQPTLQKRILAHYATLPRPLRDALFSMDVYNAMKKVVHMYNADKNASLVGDLAGLRIMGLLTKEQFDGFLRANLSVNDEQKESIIQALEKEVFASLNDEIAELFEETEVIPAPPLRSATAEPLDLRPARPHEASLAPSADVVNLREEMKKQTKIKETYPEEAPNVSASPHPFVRPLPPEKDPYLEPIEEAPPTPQKEVSANPSGPASTDSRPASLSPPSLGGQNEPDGPTSPSSLGGPKLEGNTVDLSR